MCFSKLPLRFHRVQRHDLEPRCVVKASNTGSGDEFGFSVALSADGSTLAAGAVGEVSAATGVGGNQTDNSVPAPGAVYVVQ
jgi:hypothetical protein